MKKTIIGIVTAIIVIVVAAIGFLYINNKNSEKQELEEHLASSNTNTVKRRNSNKKDRNEVDENEAEDVIDNSSEEDDGNNEEVTSDGNKILIAYFSRADENYSVGTVDVGNTEIMAGFIEDYLGEDVDTFKIDPVKAYPKGYKECTEVATEEKDSDARPKFKGKVENMDTYDTVFLGYPIWWDTGIYVRQNESVA